MNLTSLTKITLEGYKSFRKLELELRTLNVLVGANGVGKSNLISFFRFAAQLTNGRYPKTVVEAGGADSFLRYGKKITKKIFMSLEFEDSVYEIELRPDSTDSLYNEKENIFEFVETPSGLRERVLFDMTKYADDTQGRVNFVKKLLTSMNGIHVYHLADTSKTAAIKGWGALNDNIELRSDGENLAAILFKIHTQNPKAYQTIRDVICSVAPYFDDFILRPNPLNMDTIRLEWREHGSDYPFIARDLSDGTLRFMALTTLLLQPEPPAIIVIDEPELGLHPFAIEKLAGLLQTASSRAQLIVATQSPQLIAALEPEDIIVADRKDGETTMQRLNAENLKDWLEEYTLGELWQKNILGGVVNPNNVRSRGNS
jgi:predicted ATPase